MKAKPTFRKLVQVGRVVYLNEGPYKGKLAAIVDVIDTNRALIDGPCTGVPRQGFKYSEMFLTKYLVKINRSQKSKFVRVAWEKASIDQKFADSLWNQNLNKDVLRSSMTDFDRYKLGRARQTRNKIVKTAYFHIKKHDLRAKRKALVRSRAALAKKEEPKKEEVKKVEKGKKGETPKKGEAPKKGETPKKGEAPKKVEKPKKAEPVKSDDKGKKKKTK